MKGEENAPFLAKLDRAGAGCMLLREAEAPRVVPVMEVKGWKEGRPSSTWPVSTLDTVVDMGGRLFFMAITVGSQGSYPAALMAAF